MALNSLSCLVSKSGIIYNYYIVVKKKKGKLYAAFIDFKKAYDTVNRNSLLERLKKLGINGLFLRNVAAMYSKIEY